MNANVTNVSSLIIWRGSSSLLVAQQRHNSSLLNGYARTYADIKTINSDVLESLPKPIHLLAGKRIERRKNKQIEVHAFDHELPDGSLCYLGKNVFVVSPELSFLQMSRVLPLPHLIQYGCELCGNYALDGSTIIARPSVTSKAAIKAYLESWPGRQPSTALRAIRLVLDGSESPRETVLALLLCLPARLGGYGLPMPHMNYEIPLDGTAARMSGRRSFRCDLFWPECNLDLEYDSTEFHALEDKIESDSLRRNTLSHLEVDVITVTRRQLTDVDMFDDIARQVARKLGKRLRLDSSFARRRAMLRNSLLVETLGKFVQGMYH